MQFSYRGRRGAGPAGGSRASVPRGPGEEKGGEKSDWK